MKTIKDSVHGHIDVSGAPRELLDTPPVQRLRRVKQLGTASLAYPSANHTRFEHSLGVYHLARRATTHLEDVSAREATRLEVAALLHDIGHTPFSHNIEDVIHRHTGQYHDEVRDLLENNAVAAVLNDYDLSPQAIADRIAGIGQYGAVISGELDVDRMDYLVRDAHHTGVSYGVIDHERLLRSLRFSDGELVLAPGNVQSAENLLIARALMTPTVYNHHVARISKSMLRRATERLITTGAYAAETIRRFDDPQLLVALRETDVTAEYARRLDTRSLFKRAVWAELDVVPAAVLDAPHEQISEWETAIAARADVDPGHVILDVPARPAMTETTSRVIVGGEIRPLEEQSPLVDALRSAHRSQWRLGVYAPADVTATVCEAATAVLGLDIERPVAVNPDMQP